MRRRDFIFLIGGAAIARSGAANAQQAAIPRIGYLSSIGLEEKGLAAFRQGLAEFGYVEGKNISIEYRHADGNYDRLSVFAAELAALPVKLIVAAPSSPAPVALKKVTSTIPIVFFIGGDPVHLGLVESYSRPGGNITGVSTDSEQLTQRRFQLLLELLPATVLIAFLTNPSNKSFEDEVRDAQQIMRAAGRKLIVVGASNVSEIESAFESMKRQSVGGLVVWQEAVFTQERTLVTTLAARYAIPTIYGPRTFPEAGGLMSYGANREELFRLMGTYVGKVLQGTKPADLPVQPPTKFDLVINLQAAKALGLTIPPSLLAIADVIE